MKRCFIITAMLVTVLQVSAQTNNRSRTSSESVSPARKAETTQSSRPEVNTEKKAVPSAVVSSPSRQVRENVPAERTPASAVKSAPSERPSTAVNSNVERPTERTRERSGVTPQPSTVSSGRQSNSSPARQQETNTERRVNTTSAPNPKSNREASRPAINPTSDRVGTANREVQVKGRVTDNSNQRSSASRSAQSVRGNQYAPRSAVKYEQARKSYETPARASVVRTTYHKGYTYRPAEYRRVHYPYRAPAHVEIVWSVPMYRFYRSIYPDYDYWYYPVGHRIKTISAYDAGFYVGELARVYGRVEYVWYSRATKEYYLYFGGPYPYQDFSVIVPANIARKYNRRPDRFFTNRDIAITGLISRWEGKPEMLIKKTNQLDIY
jgi:hypothetical protein